MSLDDKLLAALRDGNEHTVVEALDRSAVTAPISEPVELLEFFNTMLDVLTGEGGANEQGAGSAADLAATEDIMDPLP